MPKDCRVVIRLSAEDDAWLATESERIGCDKSTFVRMLIKRAIGGPPTLPNVSLPADFNPQPGSLTYADYASSVISDDIGSAESTVEPVEAIDPDAILAARLAEADGKLEAEAQDHGPPAIPMRRIPREKYNPGYR